MTRHTPRHGRRTLLATVGSAAVAVAGCLSTGAAPDEPPEEAGRLGTPAAETTVVVRSDPAPEFAPQMVHIEVGGTVEWLVETGRHDVTAYHEDVRSFMYQPPDRTPDGVDPWRSNILDGPGASYERTFDVEGVYDYVDKQEVCVSHEMAGNVGRVVVGWPDPDAQSAMAPPPGSPPSAGAKRARTVQRRDTARSRSGTDTNSVIQCDPNTTDTTDEPC